MSEKTKIKTGINSCYSCHIHGLDKNHRNDI